MKQHISLLKFRTMNRVVLRKIYGRTMSGKSDLDNQVLCELATNESAVAYQKISPLMSLVRRSLLSRSVYFITPLSRLQDTFIAPWAFLSMTMRCVFRRL